MGPFFSDSTSRISSSLLFAPLEELFPDAESQRRCPVMSDHAWVRNGIERTLIEMESGCGFLQSLHFHPDSHSLKRSTYFEGLKSSRRLQHLRSLNDTLTTHYAQKALQEQPDAGLHESLTGFHLLAGDGHFHAASSHDARDYKGKKNAIGHLYALNLRTGLLNHLGLSGKGTSSRKPNDMASLKRLENKTLRQGATRGQKVLYIWDRAAIDYRAWERWKQGSGIYFLSREKSNTAFIKCGHLEFAQDDDLNAGILSDEQGGPSGGSMIRRVIIRSPDNGQPIAFLTNLPVSIPPGVIAQLYFMRWRIEKSFDVFKNKLAEKKSWAKSEAAKEAHAAFLVLAYNLGWLLHSKLEKEYGITDEAAHKKRNARKQELMEEAKIHDWAVPKLRQTVQAVTQLSVKYWRWIRSLLRTPTPWKQALESLRYVYAHF